MNTKKYMQTDGAWSELGCPAYPCYIGRDGCGLVSIANILIEMEQYAQYTPATIQPYCKKFMASDCEGTIWSGVPVMLKHYGLTDVMEHQNFSTLWPELAKGNRVVFYIMGSAPGGSKRVKWTSGGHCVCSVDYKYEDGLHKVYMKDSYSDSPLRNKWISYEENIRGACLAIWSGKLVGTPTPPPTPPKPGELVVDGICGAETVMAMEQFFKVEIDGEISGQLTKWKNYYPSITAISFGAGGSRVIYKLQEWLNLSDPDGILGPNTTKAWQKRLRDYGYFANPQETIDGIIGAKTMKAWQECLNNGCKPKGSPTPPTPTPTKKTKMIDVSDFQSNIDWNKVKADGIDAAIIRVGGRGGEAGVIYDDSDFFENIKGAHKAGLSVGIYFLTQAITPEEGREEAQRTIKRWTESGIPISYPIGIDSEDVSWKNPDGTIGYGRANSNKLSKAKRTAAIKAFADECKRQGYPSMLYASTNWLYDDVDMSVLSPLMDVWCAQWASSCSYTGKYIIWQYSSSGAVSGIKGRVDMDWCYVDPKQMNPPTPTPTPSGGEHYPGPYPVVKYYLEPGDKGENVTRLQNYLNWYTDGEFFKECGEPDGVYGKNTLKYANKMLTDFFGASEADGKVGNKTIAKMKEYTKPVGPTPPTPPTPGGHYTGKYPEVRVKRSIEEVLQYAIKWAIWIAANNDFHYGYGPHAHHNGCYFCGTQAAKMGHGIKMPEHTYCCNPFVHAALAHGGLIPRALKMCSEGRSWDFNKGSGYDACDLFDKLGKPSKSKLKPGDVLCNGGHVVLYIGDGKIAEASGGDDNVIHSKGWNNSIHVTSLDYSDFDRVYRLNTPVDADIIMRKGEVSERVADLQRYLIWYGALPADEEVDIYYGEKTFKAVVKMQTDFFGAKEADGTIGNKTIAKMKEYSKEEPTPSGRYTGPFPTAEEIKSASNAGIHTRMCLWGREIAADDRYRYVYFDEPYGEECALCHPHGGKNEGWQCIGLGAAVWHHGGRIPTTCNCGVIWQGRGSTLDIYEAASDAKALALAQDHFGVKDLQVIRNKGGIPKSQWKEGDYCCQFVNGNEFQHVFIYLGGKKIVDASSRHSDKSKDIDVRSYTGYSAKVIIRYTGGFSFIQKYDVGDAVLKWQDYLDWWSDGQFYKECGKGDGVFGANTHKWTVKFQEEVMGKGQGDGTVGQKTITAAKNVVK